MRALQPYFRSVSLIAACLKSWLDPCDLLLGERKRDNTRLASRSAFSRPRLRDEPTLRGWRARVHVAAAVEVVVDFGGAADHAAVKEHRECRCFEITLAERAALVVLPQQAQQEGGDHGINIDAKNVGSGADIIERLDEMPIIVVEEVVVAAFFHDFGDEPLARIVIDG